MTQQEMETIITELETTFKQPVNEKPWTTEGLAFGRYINERANYETRTFVTDFGVALWFNNEIVVTVTRITQWDAFKSVARLFRQVEQPPIDEGNEYSAEYSYRLGGSMGVETIGTRTGQCIECERVSIVSDASNLCEACTIELTTANQ